MDTSARQAIDREIALVSAALRHEFPDLSRQVRSVVQDITADIVASARIPTYLPVLIHRRARWRLKHLRLEDPAIWADPEPAACTSSAAQRLSVRLRRR